MKVGINATFLNEKPTGIGVFTREISRYMSEIHKQVMLFSPFPPTNEDIPRDCIYKVPAAMKGSPKFLPNIYRILYINTVLPILCKLKNIDVLYCPITEFPFVSVLPMVTHIHDLHPLHYPSQFGLASKRMSISLKLLDTVVSRVIVSSLCIKNELLNCTNISEGKIDVVPLAYNNLIFKPQEPEIRGNFFKKYSIKGNYILFVGTLFPYKNVTTLIKAFMMIKKIIPHDLFIVGSKKFSEEPLPEDDRIFYMDYVSNEDLPMFYSFADLFVYPSLREGFGIAPLEAMACGTPVIASNGGSLPEVIEDAGILFNPLDTESLAGLIFDVIHDKQLHLTLKEKGFRHVKKFSWYRTAEGILKSCEKAFHM